MTERPDDSHDPSRFSGTGEGVRPFRTLDTRRRASAGIVYATMAALAAILVAATGVSFLWFSAVGVLLATATYHFTGAWKMRVRDVEAMGIASRAAGFEVGHGSATLGYRGWFAKPVWQVLVYGAGPHPEHQALVTVDGLTGDVLGTYVEAVEQP